MTRRLLAQAAGLAFAGTSLLMFTSPALAAPAPEGSYTQSCRNISTKGATLSAECKTQSGEWTKAHLTDYRSCRDGVANDDGALVCGDDRDDGNRSNVADAPGGNEQSTHRDRHDRGAPGAGRSDRDNDNDTDAAATGNERSVVNTPRGRYRETCRNAHTNGKELIAECRTWDGEWHRTRLADYGACGEGIVNDDGRLRCSARRAGDQRSQRGAGERDAEERNAGDRDRNAQPSGSYQESCRNVTFTRGVLKAECRARDGWKDAAFADARSCRGDIANDRGRLVCRFGDDDRWGRITLFADARYGGGRSAYDSDTPDLGSLSGRASSASVSGGIWQLCTQRRYAGRCVKISDSVRDFTDIGLNDMVRSIRRVK